MMSRYFKTEGIVLKRINFGEADKILTIYTNHYGKIRAIAKGVRKLTSRKGGNVELFNQIVVFLNKGRNLNILTEVQVLNTFKVWRRDLKKVAVAYYFCELVDKLTPDEQSHRVVYKLLVDFLSKIGSTKGLPKLIREFEEKLLIELGFGIPAELKQASISLKSYIEEITERQINSQRVFN